MKPILTRKNNFGTEEWYALRYITKGKNYTHLLQKKLLLFPLGRHKSCGEYVKGLHQKTTNLQIVEAECGISLGDEPSILLTLGLSSFNLCSRFFDFLLP